MLKILNNVYVMIALIVLATLCYMIGGSKGLGLLVLLGFICEIGFWVGLLKSNKKPD
jgi:hypothetical protein